LVATSTLIAALQVARVASVGDLTALTLAGLLTFPAAGLVGPFLLSPSAGLTSRLSGLLARRLPALAALLARLLPRLLPRLLAAGLLAALTGLRLLGGIVTRHLL